MPCPFLKDNSLVWLSAASAVLNVSRKEGEVIVSLVLVVPSFLGTAPCPAALVIQAGREDLLLPHRISKFLGALMEKLPGLALRSPETTMF